MIFEEILNQNMDDEWKEFYLDYSELKIIIQYIISNKSSSEKLFVKKLEDFWKIHEKFVNKKINNLNNSIISKQFLGDLIRTNDFINLNLEGFRKIIKKHDKNSDYKLYPAWRWKLYYNPITKLYKKIKEVSNLYDHNETHNINIERQEFKRKSIKFWVEKKNILKVILHIIEHLPINIFDEDINDHIYQYVNSVYFDNDQLELYHKRILKEEGSNIVRIRWYNENDSKLFMERKTHHEDWTKLDSMKERFTIDSNKVVSYLKNNYIIENELAYDISNLIISKKLYPIIRTVYKRIAFQLKNNDDVRISLDIDMKIIREHTNHMQWFTDYENIEEDDINYFKYAILEIKLKDNFIENPPDWVNYLINSNLIIKKDSFSKFGHSIYTFYNHKCKRIPYWFDDNFQIINNLNETKEEDIIESNNNYNCCSIFNKKEIPVIANRVKIEPKTFFANERTFIQWFNSSMFMGSAGIAILSVNTMGVILIILSVFVIIYSLTIYYKRDRSLKNRIADGYSDLYGPIILSILTIITFVFSIIYGIN